MRKASSRYVSEPKDPQSWLHPDFFLEQERTRQSYARALHAIETLLSNINRSDVSRDWKAIVPEWKDDIRLAVALFWFGHQQTIEQPRLIAEDAKTFRKHISTFGLAVETLPIPLRKAFDVSAPGCSSSVIEEVSIRLKALEAICAVLIADQRTASRAEVIRSAVERSRILLERIVGRQFRGNLKLHELPANPSNEEKRTRPFIAFDAFFVQTVVQAIDPDVTPHQIRYALMPKKKQN